MLFLSGCGRRFETRVLDICAHLYTPETIEKSKDYLTEDYYKAIQDMVAIPDTTPLLHEWEFWFVAADGSAIADCDCEVLKIEKVDNVHANAVVRVKPPEDDYTAEEHTLLLENNTGQWLLADLNGTKKLCLWRVLNSDDVFTKDECLLYEGTPGKTIRHGDTTILIYPSFGEEVEYYFVRDTLDCIIM